MIDRRLEGATRQVTTIMVAHGKATLRPVSSLAPNGIFYVSIGDTTTLADDDGNWVAERKVFYSLRLLLAVVVLRFENQRSVK